MSTSGVTTFEATRNQIIEGALRIVGAIDIGDTPTATQYSKAAEALNMLVKALAAKGMPVWAVETVGFSLTAGINTYEVGNGTITVSKPLKILQAWNRNITSNVDIPMTILTKYDYNRLGNKTSAGNPIQLMYDLNDTILLGKISVFPTPDIVSAANQTIFFVYQRQFEDFTSGAETPDFPSEWHEALKYQLAARLADEYGMPPNDKKELRAMAMMILGEALSFGTEEGSMYLSADWRNW